MPVYRYRSIEEMKRDSRPPHGDLAERIANLWARASMLVEIPPPRGLRKFRTIEEANAEQEEWSTARARELRARRRSQ